MSTLPHVVDVEHLGDFRLRLTFSDRLVRDLDFDGVLVGGVFEPELHVAAVIDGVGRVLGTECFEATMNAVGTWPMKVTMTGRPNDAVPGPNPGITTGGTCRCP